MSQPETNDDQRYRVTCPGCDWDGDSTYPNALVAGAEADRHDERAHDGEDTAMVETVRVLTDGGQDHVDPTDLINERPAVVDLSEQGPVFVADARVRDNGWLWMKQWDNQTVKVPPHRVGCVQPLETESYGERPGNPDLKLKRLADEEWRERAKQIAEEGRGPAADGLREADADSEVMA